MYTETGVSDQAPDFEAKKRQYFIALGLNIKEAIKLHKKFDLLNKTQNEKGQWTKEWGNASEHQLVVAARTRALCQMLNLSPEMTNDVTLAAGMHDFYKKHVVGKTPKGKPMSMDQQIEADQEAETELRRAGVPEKIINLIDSVGSSPDAVVKIQSILNKGENISEQEQAALVIHYVDDFTMGSDWAAQAETGPQGRIINDLNRRIDKARQNPKYKGVDEQGKQYFGGISALDTQENLGEQVEQAIAGCLDKIVGKTINPKDLPTLIDEKIKKAIEQQV